MELQVGDFRFQWNKAEKSEVVTNCHHLQKLKYSKALPYTFTQHGAIQAANVLASAQAVEMSHDTFSRNTRAQLKQVFDALLESHRKPPVLAAV